ncbi:hypothetical protein TNCV_2494101 [Trichonephila clavipes]|uniref:Uncharacterized protein n=1 Tax=Trichonephila clavipes TaxID=2585209 RepID=A0A8X6RUW3_TRICX|nr:hypothetical protein TNCV_2494101 [Trichonephila clavipes]
MYVDIKLTKVNINAMVKKMRVVFRLQGPPKKRPTPKPKSAITNPAEDIHGNLPPEERTRPYSGLEPEPTRLTAEGLIHYTGYRHIPPASVSANRRTNDTIFVASM